MAGSERELDGELLGALLPCQGDQSRQPDHERKMAMPPAVAVRRKI
jgi:hypothetical protein